MFVLEVRVYIRNDVEIAKDLDLMDERDEQRRRILARTKVLSLIRTVCMSGY